ncbi:thioredoxin family protein [Fulvivirgaceae bacterium PWU5]|uniref:Thioredoxin family protein n=1 Tax=Dawidia cretensis TaxID=2782350 RepID=A0AAP2E544_9BACT|nr:thioredoxin family protein [Dawidia cretensis]MBT1711994.1 thioredoxin family protein [Dawidia cretensis]
MKSQLLNYRLPAVFSILFVMLYSFQTDAQQMASDPEIKFTTKTYAGVLAEAKTTHRMVFVDAFATWCGPCKELQRTTFKDAKAAAYFNKHFINYSVDVAKGEGIDLAKRWQIEGLPTLLFIDENGKVLANHTGYVDGEGLMEFAQEISEK